ncbi:MAG: hypothetical protein IKY23_04615 [Lachnospiraceae bacterium]|nr:hypothetical protein [Lachnospiraceae bacterium]
MNQNRKEKCKLPRVTLAAMTSVKVYETIKALQYSMKDIEFGEVVLITHRKPFFLPKGITYKHTSKLTDIDCFNYKMVYELGDYIDTDFVLLVHYDGFVVYPESWRDEFMDYDYVGSPWPIPKPGSVHSYHDAEGNLCRVGNSVSLRSKRLLEFPRKANLKWERDEEGFYNEDIFICCMNKQRLEEAGMQIAPVEVAALFGHEHLVPETADVDKPFVFHKWWGKNENYPRFQNPVTKCWLTFKKLVRPLLFWRHRS